MVGKVAKLDFNNSNKARGIFAPMAIYVNLDKPLVLQVLINGTIQRIEYEYPPTVFFSCGCYGHVKELCKTKKIVPSIDDSAIAVAS